MDLDKNGKKITRISPCYQNKINRFNGDPLFHSPETSREVTTCYQEVLFVERNDSGVELRTLDYENPGSYPVLRCYNLGQVFSLDIAPVHSAV